MKSFSSYYIFLYINYNGRLHKIHHIKPSHWTETWQKKRFIIPIEVKDKDIFSSVTCVIQKNMGYK
jgi:hypothetical protein